MFKDVRQVTVNSIVDKRRDQPYRSGRSPDWIKVKNPAAPAASRIIEW
jgi:ATP-dependent DNA ligase